LPVYATEFSKEEIDAEERRPKKKVAVLIGYSGSGFKGLQLSHEERTIEGELFQAFVKAGAISKANADDPKKSSLVRCARTDKGVHAAGNVLSLKLIVEDEDIVQKINDNLTPQIRVWGMERTSGSFSAYQLCDSRIYEYLIPTHCFVPPHPKSYLGKKIRELAEQAGDLEGYESRQADVSTLWEEMEEKYIKPILDELDPEIREEALRVVFEGGSQTLKVEAARRKYGRKALADDAPKKEQETTSAEQQASVVEVDMTADETNTTEAKPDPPQKVEDVEQDTNVQQPEAANAQASAESQPPVTEQDAPKEEPTPLEAAVRRIKGAYSMAKRAYRIKPERLERVRSSLSRYVGTHNYHNYTVDKSFKDASAKRVMFSFKAAPEPIIIKDTEWLSLKVHGQSFMMHQIRKMVSMCALVVRCGTHEGRIQDSFEKEYFNIPKAPGLGLLLERPVFESYNKNLRNKGNVEREAVDFTKYEKEMEEFKQREIYERIFREEEEGGFFHAFLSSLDFLQSPHMLYLSSVGYEATQRSQTGEAGAPATGALPETIDGSDDEGEEQADS
jgi:tRNA pseudouridine38-40 synthase